MAHQRDTYKDDEFHQGLEFADHIIAISKYVEETLPSTWRHKVTQSYNAVSPPEKVTERYDHAAMQARSIRFGMAARCTPDKGQDLLIEAAAKLPSDMPCEIHIWGMNSSAYAAQLRRRAEEIETRTPHRFVFCEFRSDINEFYRTVDVVVAPSRYKEPLGRGPLEAMTHLRPVIVANHGGLAELVCHEKTGLVFEPGDEVDLARQMRRIVIEPELVKTILDNGAEFFQNFTPHKYALDIDEIYKKVLEPTTR